MPSRNKPSSNKPSSNKPSRKNPSRKNPSELKRPNLLGRFDCFHCGATYKHAASLRNHRTTYHCNEQTCFICKRSFDVFETTREHMEKHGITGKLYTCTCCNWTFQSWKILLSHKKAIRTTGQPGAVKPLAISCYAPGALLKSKHGKHSDSSSTSRSSSPQSNENTMDDDTDDANVKL